LILAFLPRITFHTFLPSRHLPSITSWGHTSTPPPPHERTNLASNILILDIFIFIDMPYHWLYYWYATYYIIAWFIDAICVRHYARYFFHYISDIISRHRIFSFDAISFYFRFLLFQPFLIISQDILFRAIEMPLHSACRQRAALFRHWCAYLHGFDFHWFSLYADAIAYAITPPLRRLHYLFFWHYFHFTICHFIFAAALLLITLMLLSFLLRYFLHFSSDYVDWYFWLIFISIVYLRHIVITILFCIAIISYWYLHYYYCFWYHISLLSPFSFLDIDIFFAALHGYDATLWCAAIASMTFRHWFTHWLLTHYIDYFQMSILSSLIDFHLLSDYAIDYAAMPLLMPSSRAIWYDTPLRHCRWLTCHIDYADISFFILIDLLITIT